MIPSDPEEMQEIDDLVMTMLGDRGYGERVLFGIRLAFEEAAINAMKHGNHNDKSKKVTVTFSIDDEKAEIRVADEGPGFRLEDVPDPTLTENLEVEHGRGIFLMRAYMDEVSYNEKGNEVRLIKRAPWLTEDADDADQDIPAVVTADEKAADDVDDDLPELEAMGEDEERLPELEPMAEDEEGLSELEPIGEDEEGLPELEPLPEKDEDLPELVPLEDESEELPDLEPLDEDDAPAPGPPRQSEGVRTSDELEELEEIDPSD